MKFEVHMALLMDHDADWCRFHDPHGTRTRDPEKVTCWHCLGWMKFGPGKDVKLEAE